ncbi:unnamed protein product [Cylindrotheca closterium]|uniref:Uncharacterized protein n=1 Tax=Cylindrotheca closterium TaxID=2856 RepID=A0AAD2G002_9STRA|nr:unnamed protein product [Cylindrotheca closterium]
MKSLLWLLTLVIVFGVSSAFHTPKPPLRCSNRAKLYSYSSQNDESLNSVGDYVKQVHGGKYQFGDAGINSIGQEFAETGYGSEAPKEDVESSLLAEIPRWANRMGTERGIESKLCGTISLSSSPVSISIVNEERTWEPFYVKVLITAANEPQTDASGSFDDTHPLSIHPRAGTLAPRGGAVNLCDPNKPYSDAATITVDASGDLSLLLSEEHALYVLIGTEEEKWYYQIER